MAVDYKHPRGTKAALDALAASNSLKVSQVYHLTDQGRLALATAVNSYVMFAKTTETSGADSFAWNRIGLRSDFINGTIAFTDITGWSYTPPVNSNFTIEAEVLLQTPLTTNLPRLGLSVAAGLSHYFTEIEYQSSATAKIQLQAWGTNVAGNHQMAAGTAPVQGQPYGARVLMKGRSGASPSLIKLQLAAETAAANAAIVKTGSEFRYRLTP